MGYVHDMAAVDAQEGGGIQARLDLGDREIAEVGFLAVEDIGVVSIGADRIDFPRRQQARGAVAVDRDARRQRLDRRLHLPDRLLRHVAGMGCWPRSEEHTSELQSLMRISYAGYCLQHKNT